MGLNYDQGEEPNYGRNAMLSAAKFSEASPRPAPTLNELVGRASEVLNELHKLQGEAFTVHERIGAFIPPEAPGSAISEPNGPVDALASQLAEMSRRISNISSLVEAINSRI